MIGRLVRAGFGSTLAMLTLAGCVMTQAEVEPDGTLRVFGPTSVMRGSTLRDDWVIDSDGSGDARGNIVVDSDAGTPILTVKTGAQRFIFARRTKATLLASPYLGWSWNLAAQNGGEGEIRMIVGFYGGNPESRSWGNNEPGARLGTQLPPFDRAISILWGRSALERGSFSTATAIPEYIARGGLEHQDKWWTDNLDLSDLYRKAWPNDRFERIRIMFVGFAVGTDPGAAEARFSDIVLYR